MNEPVKAWIDRWLDLHWAQWTALGVQGYGRRESEWLIDLEALIASTLVWGDHDQRLLERTHSWCCNSREWINTTRLLRITKEFSAAWGRDEKPLLDEISTRSFLRVIKPTNRAPERLPNEIFIKEYRREARFSDSLTASLRKAALAQLSLRSIFGVTANVETLIYLGSFKEGNSNSIAKEIYATQRNIYQILERWSRTDFIRKVPTEAQNKVSLKDTDLLLKCLGLRAWPRYINWTRLFIIFGKVLRLASEPTIAESSYLFSSALRDIQNDIRWAFSTLKVTPEPDFAMPGAGFLPDFETALSKSFETLGLKP
jgi:hypothetical protein